MQETNQWATDCSLSLRDGPWQKKNNNSVSPFSASAHRENARYARLPVQPWCGLWIKGLWLESRRRIWGLRSQVVLSRNPPPLWREQPSQQWHVGPRWGLHGRQMWAPLWACTRDPHWGQPWKPRRTKSGTCKGTAWVLIGQFMSARFGPHLPKGVKSGFAPGIHMGASRGCPDGF